MILHEQVRAGELEVALTQAVIPDLSELRDAFELAKPLVRELVRRFGTT